MEESGNGSELVFFGLAAGLDRGESSRAVRGRSRSARGSSAGFGWLPSSCGFAI